MAEGDVLDYARCSVLELDPVPYVKRLIYTDHDAREDVLDDVLRRESEHRDNDRRSPERRLPHIICPRESGDPQHDDPDRNYYIYEFSEERYMQTLLLLLKALEHSPADLAQDLIREPAQQQSERDLKYNAYPSPFLAVEEGLNRVDKVLAVAVVHVRIIPKKMTKGTAPLSSVI